jgi:DNA-binding MarR family transcriptional regulator
MANTQSKKGRKSTPLPAGDAELLDQCALFDVHRLARAMTQLYNQHMRETGLTMAQFTLLRNIAAMAPAGMTQIAEAMLMDRTSVTHLIDPLIDRGLLATEAGEDRRVRNVIATKEGLAALRHSEQAWQLAQRDYYERVGADQWRTTSRALRNTLKMVREG